MKRILAWAGQSWKPAVPVLAAILLLSGCIPSEPKNTETPVPAAAEYAPSAAPAAVNGADVPSVQTPAPEQTRDGQPVASLKIDPLGKANASVAVESVKDGGGFTFKGTFNLSGTIIATGPGKWKLSGQFSVAEPDFEIGTPLATAMGTFSTGTDGTAGMSTNAALVLIDIPVRPPAARAPEGTAPRNIPVLLDFDAPDNAQFTVTLTQK